jgi:thiol-disulfide isomerase/thioredoxin
LLFAVASAGRAADASLLRGEVDAKALSAALAGEKGHVVLLNFWATWCVPCREEFPDFVRLEKTYRERGLRVVGVSIDLARDLPKIETFLAAAHPDFPNYRKKSGGDEQDFIESVDPKWGGELPFTVLYGKDGKKLRVLSGKQSYADLEKAIQPLLQPGS